MESFFMAGGIIVLSYIVFISVILITILIPSSFPDWLRFGVGVVIIFIYLTGDYKLNSADSLLFLIWAIAAINAEKKLKMESKSKQQ
jgi:hypothetical protein